MELIFFGINLLLIMAVWHFMLRPSILDHSRDRLFDLRDELRTTFIDRKWDLGSPAYQKLRDLVNGHLRFTEEMSLSRTSFVTASVKHDKDLQEFIHVRVSKVFASSDPLQQKFILDFRRRALTVAMDYAISSSGFLLMLALILAPFVATEKFIKMLNRRVDFTAALCVQKLRNLGGYISFSMSTSKAHIARALMLPDLVESYSLRPGMA